MADAQIARPKRQGNYVPERIKALEGEIAGRYASGESAAALAREYGMSKTGIQSAARRQGVVVRGKPEAGVLARRIDYNLTPEEQADSRSIAEQVAERLGYASSAGLSYDRAFQTACTREYRRRSVERYREMDRRRKQAQYRIPKWQRPGQIAAFYAMAADLGLEVDHIIPLQGEVVSGLNVMSNLRLLNSCRNQSKQNRFEWGPDPLIGPPKGFDEGSEGCSSSD